MKIMHLLVVLVVVVLVCSLVDGQLWWTCKLTAVFSCMVDHCGKRLPGNLSTAVRSFWTRVSLVLVWMLECFGGLPARMLSQASSSHLVCNCLEYKISLRFTNLFVPWARVVAKREPANWIKPHTKQTVNSHGISILWSIFFETSSLGYVP